MTDEPKNEQRRADEFIAEYKALCDKHGLTIGVVPTWKQSLDTGDWRLVLQTSVQPMRK